MGDTGLEQTARKPSKTAISKKRGAKSGALESDFSQKEPDLAEVVRAWPGLSKRQRAEILRIVRGDR
jgi:hypothetical protein